MHCAVLRRIAAATQRRLPRPPGFLKQRGLKIVLDYRSESIPSPEGGFPSWLFQTIAEWAYGFHNRIALTPGGRFGGASLCQNEPNRRAGGLAASVRLFNLTAQCARPFPLTASAIAPRILARGGRALAARRSDLCNGGKVAG
ncbi:hypothetical protein SKAU_G00124170 [Synaphobranchus kaupii]|uniref:Uncharacterized protein n=1 Tax=Synaphobranchus kaupii TaxID=118154 RepID=A0A9Q1FPN6_SYNKA|nr:hypothetical protein SKAU_G00124170 [Synaphobranchus kaupii]